MVDTRDKTAGAAAILHQFICENPIHERNAAKRVLAEVVRAWPGDAHRLWWKWFSEASISLGLRAKVLDCTPGEAVDLVRNHAQIICYREDPENNKDFEWLGVLGSSKRRYEVLISAENDCSRVMCHRELRRTLAGYAVNGTIRCAVMQPVDAELSSNSSTGSPQVKSNGKVATLTPFARLLQLLKPETPDLSLVLLFALVVSILMLATPIAVEALVNTVAFGRFVQPIVILAVILLTFLGFEAALRALQTYVVEIVQRRLFARVAGDLAFRLPRADAESLDGKYVPELVNRFFDVVSVQKVAAQLLLEGIGLVLSALIGMALLGFYHPWLLGFDLILITAIGVIIFVLGRGAVGSAVNESKHKYHMAQWLEDIARCPTAFRNDGGADFSLERADHLINGYLIARKSHFRIVLRQIMFALGLQAVASTVLLGLGGWLVVSGELTLGQLVAAELIVTVIVGSFAKIGKYVESFYDLLASVDKLGVLFDIPTERQDGMLAVDRTLPAKVELNAVRYQWSSGQTAVRSLSAKFRAGESVAILGESGSGKSTLIDLMFGIRRPTTGFLTIDGFDPRDLRPDVLRDRVSLVRDAEVFHATILENVHLHRDDVTTTEVRQVLDDLGLLEPILRFKDGCDTILSSDGKPLSTTQSRMLGIARAAIGRPGLLLVDGTLDSLGDNDLERCLGFLLRTDQPWTLMVTTSRKDIAQRFDRTLFLTQNPLISPVPGMEGRF